MNTSEVERHPLYIYKLLQEIEFSVQELFENLACLIFQVVFKGSQVEKDLFVYGAGGFKMR